MKRVLIVFLILALVLSSAATALAEELDDTVSAAVRTQVLKYLEDYRGILDISQDTSKMKIYNSSPPNEEATYNISWQSETHWYSIYLNDAGDLILYGIHPYFVPEESKLKTGALSKEHCQVIAESLLEQLYPHVAKELRLTDVQKNDDEWQYRYNLFKNDIEVSYANVYIQIDRYNGTVTGISAKPLNEIAKYTFPTATQVLDEEKANSIFSENSHMILGYFDMNYFPKYYEEAVLIYYFENKYIYIDAKTGEPTEIYDYWSETAKDYNTLSAHTSRIEDLIERDPATYYKKELQSVTELITQSQAEKNAKNKIPQLAASTSPKYAYCQKTYLSEIEYIWNLFFDTIEVQIDAISGQLISFTDYSTSSTSGGFSQEEALKVAQQYINKEQPDKAKQVKFDPNIYDVILDDDSYEFVLYQHVNDIPFLSNYIYVSVDKLGNVSGYYLNWEHSPKFPDVSVKVSYAEAMASFILDQNIELIYIPSKDNTPILVYTYRNHEYRLMDAATGEEIRLYGVISDTSHSPETIGYTDVDGKWYEEVVNTLLDNDFAINEEPEFKGGAEITQSEFLRFLFAGEMYWNDNTELYEYLLEEGVIGEDEVSPDEHLTRQDAAKFAVRYLGYDELAQHGFIFENHYSDWIDPAYIGYAASAKSLGLINGDQYGNFNGTKIMTRAEAAVLIYNMLIV